MQKKELVLLVAIPLDEQGHAPGCPKYDGGDKKASTGVTSDAYRQGWDTIFGKKTVVGES